MRGTISIDENRCKGCELCTTVCPKHIITMADRFTQRGYRPAVLQELTRNGIGAVFHYVPLHSSPAGRRFGRSHGDLSLTTDLSLRLIRLPMWLGLSEAQQARVVEVLAAFLRK